MKKSVVSNVDGLRRAGMHKRVKYVYEMPWVRVCGMKAVQRKTGGIGLMGMWGGKNGMRVWVSENGFKRKGDGYPDYFMYIQAATPKGIMREVEEAECGERSVTGGELGGKVQSGKEYRRMVKEEVKKRSGEEELAYRARLREEGHRLGVF
jgi:hypothetical protein